MKCVLMRLLRWKCRDKRDGMDSGRASLEFLVAGVVLFIPTLLVAISLWSIQQAALATDAAARHGVRTLSQATSPSGAIQRTELSVGAAMAAFGVDRDYTLSLDCRPHGACLSPGAWVQLTVTATVELGAIPLVPASIPLRVPISGSAQAQVSDYRGVR